MHKHTDKQTDRRYENNSHLPVNQLEALGQCIPPPRHVLPVSRSVSVICIAMDKSRQKPLGLRFPPPSPFPILPLGSSEIAPLKSS